MSQTIETLSRIVWNDLASSSRKKRPSRNTTHGPSVSSDGVIAQAFPGRSIFICVPIVMKSSIANIHAVFADAAASPEGRLRPYLSRNPPGCKGAPKTGLPAIISFINFVIGATFLDLNLLALPLLSSSFPLLANFEINSHPAIFILSVCFWIFGAFRHIPSPMTSNTPPRILASSIFLTRPYPAHSILSVDSPLIIIGQALTISSISCGGGLYCRLPRYNPNSSFTRSISGWVGI